MSSLFSKKDADDIVIENLLKEIRKLRRLKMPIVKTVDGRYYRVENDQEVSEADIQDEVNELQAKVAELQAIIAPADIAVAAEETIVAADQPAVEGAETVALDPPLVDPPAEPVVEAPVLQ